MSKDRKKGKLPMHKESEGEHSEYKEHKRKKR